RLFVVLRLRYRGEQEKRKSHYWKKLPGLTFGQHLRILPKRDFRCETRPMCSQTNFRPVDSETLDANRIPRLDGILELWRLRARNLQNKRNDANGQAPRIGINAPDY